MIDVRCRPSGAASIAYIRIHVARMQREKDDKPNECTLYVPTHQSMAADKPPATWTQTATRKRMFQHTGSKYEHCKCQLYIQQVVL